jgi:hypothetical protein
MIQRQEAAEKRAQKAAEEKERKKYSYISFL